MAKKDPGEYDYEGDMAISQLKSILTNAKRLHDMLEPDTNLPEWVQSKITLAEDYIVTAANYMEGAMNEEAAPSNEMKPQQNAKKQPVSAKKERQDVKSAAIAQKALDIAKGKKNRINTKPELGDQKC